MQLQAFAQGLCWCQFAWLGSHPAIFAASCLLSRHWLCALHMLRLPLFMLLQLVSQLVNARVAIDCLQEVLGVEEQQLCFQSLQLSKVH